MNKSKKINSQINKAIATTVVITALGISSTINSLPVGAASLSNLNRANRNSTQTSVQHNSNVNKVESEDEVLTLNEYITFLLKQGEYKEARELRKSFYKYSNPLRAELRELGFYAVVDNSKA